MTPYLWCEYFLTLVMIDNFTHKNLEQLSRQFCEAHHIKLKDLAQPIRLALTGVTISPPLFDVMELLGQKECLQRIANLWDWRRTHEGT